MTDYLGQVTTPGLGHTFTGRLFGSGAGDMLLYDPQLESYTTHVYEGNNTLYK